MQREKFPLTLLVLLVFALAGCGTTGGGGESGSTSTPAMAKPKPIVIPAGTEIDVRLTTGLSSESNSAGDPFEGTLDNAVMTGGRVAIPKGSEVKGQVTSAVKSGRLKQRAELWVTVTEINVRGNAYEVATDTTGHKEGSKTKRNILFIGGGAGAGAAIGGATGGGKGAGIGALIGAGAGTAGAMLTGKHDVKFPPETLLRFQLEKDLSIQP
ncbi:MAG: hypothetical protein ACRD35_10110 [Candidatus Acidiferrales bacterium]